MNEQAFLRMLFDGHVICYGAHRWHTAAYYADMTQIEIEHFRRLGLMLGHIAIREWMKDPCRNPRDLVWIKPGLEKYGLSNNVFLHLERENEDKSVLDCLNNPGNKLLNSANLDPGRYLIGLFGWLRDQTWTDAVRLLPRHYADRNVLIIGWVGEEKDKAAEVRGLVWSGRAAQKRRAVAKIDDGGFWYIHFQNGWEEDVNLIATAP